MNSPFLDLSKPTLLNLAIALERNRLRLPTTGLALNSFVPPELRTAVEKEINYLYEKGANAFHIGYTLRMMAAERQSAQQEKDKVDLVWTGNDILRSESRNTSVVIRELFLAAQRIVILSTYAMDKNSKARSLFQLLSKKMDTNPNLIVKIYLNINPSKNCNSSESLVREFSENFRNKIWNGTRLPEVFYYPQSLVVTGKTRTCLHAKCIAIDDEKLLITSANFTRAAHERNIEAGILIHDNWAAKTVRIQFQNLVEVGVLKRVPGL
jgi:phosphatidylserine/phosphatidylglycerophosphate/cardiolipin synthase-like enzyme